MLTRRNFFKGCCLAGGAALTKNPLEILAGAQNDNEEIDYRPDGSKSYLAMEAIAKINSVKYFERVSGTGWQTVIAHCYAFSGGDSLIHMELHYLMKISAEALAKIITQALPIGSIWLFYSACAEVEVNKICLYGPSKEPIPDQYMDAIWQAFERHIEEDRRKERKEV